MRPILMMIVQNFFEFRDVKVNLSDDLMNEINLEK